MVKGLIVGWGKRFWLLTPLFRLPTPGYPFQLPLQQPSITLEVYYKLSGRILPPYMGRWWQRVAGGAGTGGDGLWFPHSIPLPTVFWGLRELRGAEWHFNRPKIAESRLSKTARGIFCLRGQVWQPLKAYFCARYINVGNWWLLWRFKGVFTAIYTDYTVFNTQLPIASVWDNTNRFTSNMFSYNISCFWNNMASITWKQVFVRCMWKEKKETHDTGAFTDNQEIISQCVCVVRYFQERFSAVRWILDEDF